MDAQLSILLSELEAFGREHDAATAERPRRMRNIVPETGEFLFLLLRAVRARQVLELGTSNGYSTLWLAAAVQPRGGWVTTLEVDAEKIRMARENFARAGSAGQSIELREGDARQSVQSLPPAAFDVIFLDTERSLYIPMWPSLQRLLKLGGLFAVDNAVSHAGEQEEFFALAKATPGYSTSLNPVGKGVMLMLKPG